MLGGLANGGNLVPTLLGNMVGVVMRAPHQVVGWGGQTKGDGWPNPMNSTINEEKDMTDGWVAQSFIVDHMLGSPNWHEI